MLDFIMGWVLGRNIHKDLSPIEDFTFTCFINCFQLSGKAL